MDNIGIIIGVFILLIIVLTIRSIKQERIRQQEETEKREAERREAERREAENEKRKQIERRENEELELIRQVKYITLNDYRTNRHKYFDIIEDQRRKRTNARIEETRRKEAEKADAFRKAIAKKEEEIRKEAERKEAERKEAERKEAERKREAERRKETERREALIDLLPDVNLVRGGDNWNYIYNYYPVNRYSWDELSESDRKARNEVFDFKDGKNPVFYAKIFAGALIKKYGFNRLQSKTLVIIPASTGEKTKKRFYKFCLELCKITGMQNGYSLIVNDSDREATHTSGRNIDLSDYIRIDEYAIEDRDIIVIDDVRTRGRSSDTIYNLLDEAGAEDINFVFLAKTVWS